MGKSTPTPTAGSPEAIDLALAELTTQMAEYTRLRNESGFKTHDSEIRTRLFLAMRAAGVMAPNIAISQDDFQLKPLAMLASEGRFAPWLAQTAANLGRPYTSPGHQPEPAE